jgi:Peptidase A4 family
MIMKTREDEVAEGLDILLQEIRKNTRFFPVPPKGFDPRTADVIQLHEFGLPSKPDRFKQPEEYAFWWRMFSPPLNFVAAAFSFPVPEYRFNHLGPLPVIGTRYETSSNWSGGYITPKQGRTFIEVHGNWQVPTPSPPVAVAGGVPTDDDYRSSTWIGFDGQRRYLNSSLPQIGTAQFVKVVNHQPTPTTIAWWQWWVRDHKNPPVVLSLAVKPGDLMMCKLIVINSTTVRFIIKNQTTGQIVAPFDEPAPKTDMKHLPSPVQVKVSGATAEWVMERPKHFDSDEFYELPDYGTVVFSECLAVSAPAPGSAGRNQKLPGAKLINMFEVSDHPHRISNISTAKREGDQEVAIFYR